MNQLQNFIFNGNEFRAILKDNQPWFIAKDVCDILGINNVSLAVNGRERINKEGQKYWSGGLDDDEKLMLTVSISGQNREVLFVNEYGLYNLILKSHKPEAKQFKRWVTHEVIPSIRKTGGYVANDDLFIETYLPHADEQTKMTFKATLALVRKQNEQIEVMKPKAEYFDALVDRNLLTNFRDTAKELHIKQSEFINWLLSKKYVYRDQKGKLKPYAKYVPELFQLKEWERNGKADVQTLITPKGRETFRLLINKAS